MRKQEGMFPTPEWPHEFPEDDFEHQKSMDCPCKPYKQWDAGKGTRHIHKPIVTEEVDWDEYDNSFPEDWCKPK